MMEAQSHFIPRFYGAAISTYVVALLSVPAKVWCRTRINGWSAFGWDDGLAIASLVFVSAFFWLAMFGTQNGVAPPRCCVPASFSTNLTKNSLISRPSTVARQDRLCGSTGS